MGMRRVRTWTFEVPGPGVAPAPDPAVLPVEPAEPVGPMWPLPPQRPALGPIEEPAEVPA